MPMANGTTHERSGASALGSSSGRRARGMSGTTLDTDELGSDPSDGSTFKRSRPRGKPESARASPPRSGMRTTKDSEFVRAGSFTSTRSGGSPRARRVTAPDRSQASHPPPSHARQVRFLGSSSSMTDPCSSQAFGTRMRCNASGPRGKVISPVMTRPRTLGTISQ